MTSTDEITLQRFDLGPADRIPLGEGRKYRLGKVEVAVFRTRYGAIHAVQSECPHAGGPLADGLVGGGKVVCPLHGYVFDLNTGAALRDSCSSLRTYNVTLSEDGHIMLDAAEEQC